MLERGGSETHLSRLRRSRAGRSPLMRGSTGRQSTRFSVKFRDGRENIVNRRDKRKTYEESIANNPRRVSSTSADVGAKSKVEDTAEAETLPNGTKVHVVSADGP